MALQKMQNLVGAAGEALGLTEDPLHTKVGLKVGEKQHILQYIHSSD